MMKNIILSMAFICCFTFTVTAQEDIEQLQQQPPPAAERQVESDVKKAAEQQKPKDLRDKKPAVRNNEISKTTNDTVRKKRASRKPGKQ